MSLEIVPADSFEPAQLAALFTAGYEGYFVPLHVDEPMLAWMIDTGDLRLARSRVAVRDGEPVGICVLGVRGERGWVGGLGVTTAERRTGVGRALMTAVLAEAPADVTLEVIEQNEPALRLYEALGFVRTRWLEVWSLTATVPDHEVRSVEPQPLGQDGLPWQRADESLPVGYERIELDGGAALFKVGVGRAVVLQLAADDERTAAELLSAIRNRSETLRYVNLPAGDPASAALAALRGTLDFRQIEMRLVR